MFSGFTCVFLWNMLAPVVENCGIQLSSTGKLFTFHPESVLLFVLSLSLQAIRVSINPLYFMIPATVGCSYAFMLPVSTPPNSIAFASGHLMVKDMVGRRNISTHTKTRLKPFHRLSSRLLPCFLRWKPALSWTSWASSRSLWPWTRGALQCLTCTRIQNGLDPSTRLRSSLVCTSHPSSQWMLRSDHSISAWARRRDQKFVNRFNTKQGQESVFRHLCHYNVGTLWELHLLPIMMNLIILGCLRRL